MLHEENSFTNGGAMRDASLDLLCEFVIKAWHAKSKRSKVIKKCGISNAMDDTEYELLYESEDENEAEVDSPDSDCDPYHDETVNDDLHDELFASDDDDSSNFEGYILMQSGFEPSIAVSRNRYLTNMTNISPAIIPTFPLIQVMDKSRIVSCFIDITIETTSMMPFSRVFNKHSDNHTSIQMMLWIQCRNDNMPDDFFT